MPIIHFMHGFIGSGKTTFAKKLEQELPAIRFNNDELMVMLFGRNIPEQEFKPAYQKIDKLIWMLIEKNIALGNDVVLDLGFWSRNARDYARKRAKNLGVDYKFYNIYAPFDIALQRTLKRSTESGELLIDENCFNLRFKQFELMSEDEDFIFVDNSLSIPSH